MITAESNNITLTNNFRTLIVDEDSDFDKHFDNNIIIENLNNIQAKYNPIYTRPTVAVNQKPENDKSDHNKPRHVPGNSNYANMTNPGKKILILSDSICGRIRMKGFDNYIMNGYAYRKSFPGATPKELAHYCIPTLLEDKPDICIINVGTNSLNKNDHFQIADDISNVVNICRSYGVTDVYVSSVIYNQQYQKRVIDLNNLLSTKQLLNDFILIKHDNINVKHIWRDKIHLNELGSVTLANNFINCMNRKHTT